MIRHLKAIATIADEDGVAYIDLRDQDETDSDSEMPTVAKTLEMRATVNVDFGPDGQPVGIELLYPAGFMS